MELVVEFIRENQVAAEFLLYFVFFGSLARASLFRHFNEHAGALSVGIGACLAAALLLAKHRLGYSLEALGKPAVALIVLAICVVAYRFLAWSEAPTPVALLAALGLGAIALNAALPDWQVTRQVWFETHVLVVLSLISAAGLVGTSSDAAPPGVVEPLVRAGLLPQGRALKDEARELKKAEAKKIGREERRAGRHIQKATRDIQSMEQKSHKSPEQNPRASTQNTLIPQAKRNTEKHKTRITKRIELAEREANRALHQLVQLQQLDRAIEQFDLTQLSRATKTNLREFTPQQRQALQKNLTEERARLNLEEQLSRLANATEHAIVTLRGHLESATNAAKANNYAAAEGWLEKANEPLQYAAHTSQQIQQLRAQLIRSLQRQARATR